MRRAFISGIIGVLGLLSSQYYVKMGIRTVNWKNMDITVKLRKLALSCLWQFTLSM